MGNKPQNLFTTTTFWLIVLGGILYSKPIILSIIEKGFNADRVFDLASGLTIGAIATKKKMDEENVYTPDGILGRDKSAAIAAITSAVATQPVLAVQNIQPLAEIAAVTASTIKTVNDVAENPFEALKGIKL